MTSIHVCDCVPAGQPSPHSERAMCERNMADTRETLRMRTSREIDSAIRRGAFLRGEHLLHIQSGIAMYRCPACPLDSRILPE